MVLEESDVNGWAPRQTDKISLPRVGIKKGGIMQHGGNPKSLLNLLILGDARQGEDGVGTNLARVEVRAFPTRPST